LEFKSAEFVGEGGLECSTKVRKGSGVWEWEENSWSVKKTGKTGLEVTVLRIHMFLGLLNPDPDPLVRGMDPDPAFYH
jgi:hypothetical protein